MIQATVPVYIRFGELPNDGQSEVHWGDYTARKEGGISVWRAIKANGQYYPMLHSDANEDGIADFYRMVMQHSDPIYLVTGQEIRLEGADREPLLKNVVILKQLHYAE